MQSPLHLITWYPLFLVPAGIGWGAVWVSAGNSRIDLQFGDKALLVLPWLALCAVSVLVPQGKTLANFAEVVLLSASVPLAFIVRTAIGRVADQARVAMRITWVVSGLGVLIWLALPDLGTPPAPS